MKIKEARSDKGLNQKEFASLMGVAANTLSQYETGKREPDIQTMWRMADALGCSVDYLLGRDTKNQSTAGDDGLAEWLERLRSLTPDDRKLFLQTLQGLEDNPEAMRAALDLALKAAQSVAKS